MASTLAQWRALSGWYQDAENPDLRCTGRDRTAWKAVKGMNPRDPEAVRTEAARVAGRRRCFVRRRRSRFVVTGGEGHARPTSEIVPAMTLCQPVVSERLKREAGAVSCLAAAVIGLVLAASVGGLESGAHASIIARVSASESDAVLATQNCRYGIRRPKQIVFFCADNGGWVNRLRWSRWGGRIATGTGSYSEKLCVPDCATGGISTFFVRVRLYSRRSCPGRSHRYYQRATLIDQSGRRLARTVPCPL